VSQSLLIVDDDEGLRTQLARAFTRRGFRVRTAAGHEEAIDLAADEAPALAIVDLRIERDNGLEVVRDLLRIEPSTRVVVLTGYGSIATAIKAMRLGAVDYLEKPADADDLIAAFSQAERLPEIEGEPSREPASLAKAEWEHIQRVLTECDGNVTHAAQLLGIHRRSLQRKLRRPPDS
jgi:two-component system, response regulator RegA